MTIEQLLREIEALPAADRKQVADFIAFLRFRAKKQRPRQSSKRKPLTEEPFVGMWKDREDMRDGGAAWVRRLRENEWTRTRSRPKPN